MKLSGIILILVFSTFCFSTFAQNETTTEEKFKVYGNCDMCKNTIETVVQAIDGVNYAKWNVDTKKMTVKFESSKTDIESIKKEIAGVGYDTKEYRADDNTYNALHSCCKYKRPKPIK